MKKSYSARDLDKAYESLNSVQKAFLDEHVKRGKKTKWLNIFAEKKGAVLTEKELEDPEMTMNSLLEWVLLDYEECAYVNPDMRCECGKALKRRYTLLHKSTGELIKLGIVHFAEHTGLSPELVRLVTKGLKTIDLERDEILTRLLDGWHLPFAIPEDIMVPEEMQKQMDSGLPLLDRQEKRLVGIIKMYSSQNPFELREKQIGNLSYEAFALSIESLKSTTINSEQAEALFYFVKNHKRLLNTYGYSIEDIISLSVKSLGKIKDKNVRKWLVELEYLII